MDPYLGEIKLCAFQIAPKGWAFCNGGLLPINTNQALYSLIGTHYGGDGKTTFALPDLRGRTPLHRDYQNYNNGTAGGAEAVTLTPATLPAHNHQFNAVNADGKLVYLAGAGAYKGMLAALSPAANIYAGGTLPATAAMNEGACSGAGGSAPHNNMQPSLVSNFIIALVGVYPSRP